MTDMVRGKARDAQTPPPQSEPESEVPAGTPPAEAEEGAPKNDKPVDLTPEQAYALSAQWARKIEAQKERVDEAKKEYDSERQTFRGLYKQVKAELGEEGVERVKLLVMLETDENGETRLRSQLANMVWAAQWANAIPGQQIEMFNDIRPDDDQAFDRGKKDGLAGKPFSNHYGQGTLQFHRYQDGYAAGQDILAAGFKPLEKPPEDVGEPKGDAAAQA